MPKRKRIPLQVKDWLRTNRHGRLTTEQWLTLVTEPLIALLILGIPLLLIFWLTPVGVVFRYLQAARWLVLLFPVLLILMLGFRARRYATLPLKFETLYAGKHSVWPWQPPVFHQATGEPVRFGKSIVPGLRTEIDKPYVVYYLEEPRGWTLVSAAPAEHPDSDGWQPSDRFHQRQARRAG